MLKKDTIIKLPVDLLREAKGKAEELELSFSGYIRRLVEADLRRELNAVEEISLPEYQIDNIDTEEGEKPSSEPPFVVAKPAVATQDRKLHLVYTLSKGELYFSPGQFREGDEYNYAHDYFIRELQLPFDPVSTNQAYRPCANMQARLARLLTNTKRNRILDKLKECSQLVTKERDYLRLNFEGVVYCVRSTPTSVLHSWSAHYYLGKGKPVANYNSKWRDESIVAYNVFSVLFGKGIVNLLPRYTAENILKTTKLKSKMISYFTPARIKSMLGITLNATEAKTLVLGAIDKAVRLSQ